MNKEHPLRKAIQTIRNEVHVGLCANAEAKLDKLLQAFDKPVNACPCDDCPLYGHICYGCKEFDDWMDIGLNETSYLERLSK